MDAYAQVMIALVGRGWSTVEETARRTSLPQEMVNHALTELLGEGKILVKYDPAGKTLVYRERPTLEDIAR